MARLLKELVRKPNSSSLIATLTHQNTPLNLTPQLFANHHLLFNQGVSSNPSNTNGFRSREEEEQQCQLRSHLSKLQIYPSFSFGLFLNPILPTGSDLSQLISPVGDEMEHPGMMWADSVKKKRKRKMNKHKLKKQRKRLRRKTKKP